MIPKVIHYCWFGRNPKPELVLKCIDSWKQVMPDYEIIEWNENNYDVNKTLYTSQAYDKKIWAFVSDYARHDILYQNGGIYLDTDVELIKSLDPIVKEGKPFGGLDSFGWFTSGLGYGGPKSSPIFRVLRDDYKHSKVVLKNGKLNMMINTQHEINVMAKCGIKKGCTDIQVVGGMVIYPKEYFCPIDFNTNECIVTGNTYSIHHYTCTWMSDATKRKLVERHPELAKRYNL